MAKTPSHLGFDFGTKSIGIASGRVANDSYFTNELPPMKAKDGIPNWQALEALLDEWKPSVVVVGLPVNMDGSEMPLTQRARKFGNRIHGRFAYPVEFFDERLSTREAKEIAYERGIKGSYNENPVDSIAARLILESWWNNHSSEENKT